MDYQIRISDLENVISEKVFIKIEKWNLYLGDAGLARQLAIECISNKDRGPLEAAKLSLKAINVKVGDGINIIPLINLITNSQILELEEILESFF
ncbi:DUF3181 family protein [Prochlorococcus sp. AH-736-N03]|nr:DUF3181 family protein [Prochlorococcus sp. AH-736-N03]